MSDWGSEAESAFELVQDAAHKLKEVDPTHELLSFWFAPEGEEFSPEAEQQRNQALYDRFWNREKPWTEVPAVQVATVVLAHYFLAIKNVLEQQGIAVY